ncbi:MAG: glycogen/starch synthase, partial [Oscillospiraceae bacterium]|nr:glycogen/starch synthase [Oscillospiraceae bacterium]
MRILYAASEAVPFAASGGLADVAGSLPSAIVKAGHDCRVVMPLYKNIKPDLRAGMTYITNFTVDVSWRKQYCGIFTSIVNGVTYYFLDNEYYFGRDGLYGFYDDAERFVFFSRAILEMLKHIDFMPQIINANDWQTALVPVYYDVFYRYQPEYENIKTVFTIHNIQYQGKYGLELIKEVIGIPTYHSSLLEYDGCVNMMKGAIE